MANLVSDAREFSLLSPPAVLALVQLLPEPPRPLGFTFETSRLGLESLARGR